ncbi:hypothetical protein SHKM778_42990 [Streptomyces sp. KM77-8]|uniref:Uncharacterized protein n=1 Tax=Streptomyces haneummycinicus TaxID=3074435 RepID=A0AAT9HKY8_9ACTN
MTLPDGSLRKASGTGAAAGRRGAADAADADGAKAPPSAAAPRAPALRRVRLSRGMWGLLFDVLDPAGRCAERPL